MFQCGFFLIGGIVAAGAGAGVVSVPADCRTGRGFCCVLLQVMFQCGQFFAGDIVAAGTGAGFVSPALFRTGWSLRIVLHQVMLQRGQFFAGGIVAAGAGFVSLPADFRTGRGFCCVLLQIMTELVNPVSLRIGTVSA